MPGEAGGFDCEKTHNPVKNERFPGSQGLTPAR